MKVAVWHDFHSGGGKRALYYHLQALVERGHQVTVWTPSTRDRDWAPLADFGQEHVHPLDYDDSWTAGERIGWQPRGRRLIEAMNGHVRRCAAEMEAGGFDLLFANSSYRVAVSAIGRVSRLPSVLYLQEPMRSLYEARPDLIWAAAPAGSDLRTRWRGARNVASARLQVREEALNVAGYDEVLCNSYFSRESLLRAYGRDSSVCYLGVDDLTFSPDAGAREEHVIGLGQLGPWKNPRLAIAAVAEVPPPRPPLIWVSNVADHLYSTELTAFAAECGVSFEVKNKLPDAELRHLLATARAMIYTSSLEPFGFAPLEANACGTPVVAVAEGGVRETVIDGVNGLLADSDPAALAAALTRLVRDPALADRLGKQGRALVQERWTLEQAGDRLINRLEKAALRRIAA